ncbi:chloride channel protein [Cupriavidus sp. 8B]
MATAAGFPIGRQGPSIYLGAVIVHKLGSFLRRPAVFGALCGLLVAAMAMTTSGTSPLGVEQVVSGILEGSAASPGDPLARGLALLATCVAGIPGGTFVPSLSIGASNGGLRHE